MTFDLENLLNEVSRGFADIQKQHGGKDAQEPPELTVHTTSLASINDAFRSAENDAGIPGMKVLSPVLEESGDAVVSELHTLVREHRDFDASDQEHAFGLFVHPTMGEVVWQIDYFEDESCEQPAMNPEDGTQTYRVLSVFTAREIENA